LLEITTQQRKRTGGLVSPHCEDHVATKTTRHSTIEDTFSSLICRLRHEFLGTPALALTPSHVASLWGLDRVTSECLLDFLAARGYVHKTKKGAYTRW
jgi:hypothetical protein